MIRAAHVAGGSAAVVGLTAFLFRTVLVEAATEAVRSLLDKVARAYSRARKATRRKGR